MSAQDNISQAQFPGYARKRAERNRAAAAAECQNTARDAARQARKDKLGAGPTVPASRDTHGWEVHPGTLGDYDDLVKPRDTQAKDEQAREVAEEAANPVWDHRPAYSRMKIVPGGLPGHGKRR